MKDACGYMCSKLDRRLLLNLEIFGDPILKEILMMKQESNLRFYEPIQLITELLRRRKTERKVGEGKFVLKRKIK